MNEVLDFIKRRWSNTDAHWTDGNCYWFALILVNRFSFLKIYYLPLIGHFVAGNSATNEYYDALGQYELTERTILFDDIKEVDNFWYEHIVRDCIK
jgi:hypothetical protein